jgi:tight adherence protein B
MARLLSSERADNDRWITPEPDNGSDRHISSHRGTRLSHERGWNMTGFLLGVVFAAGVALLFLHMTGVRVPMPTSALRIDTLLDDAGLGASPGAVLGGIGACGLLAGVLVWWIVDVPAVIIAGVLGAVVAPVAWLRSRRESLRRERERAWPAVLGQLADALEAGLAFPAAVGLVADSGPTALRGDFAAFRARLRGSDLTSALDGLRRPGERTTDSVALLLRAALLELPTGGLAPVLRELAGVLSERLEAREKARSRTASLGMEAAILALSPIVILLLIGVSSPGFLAAYRTTAGTVVSLLCGGLIFGCYLLMRRLGQVPEPRSTRSEGSR